MNVTKQRRRKALLPLIFKTTDASLCLSPRPPIRVYVTRGFACLSLRRERGEGEREHTGLPAENTESPVCLFSSQRSQLAAFVRPVRPEGPSVLSVRPSGGSVAPAALLCSALLSYTQHIVMLPHSQWGGTGWYRDPYKPNLSAFPDP